MRRTIAAVLLGTVCAFAAVADTTPEPPAELGFNAGRAFHTSGVDVVNEYNGNLVITIPIGQSYRVDGNLSYGFTLSYNSKVWELENLAPHQYWHVVPSRESLGALGWYFSAGELYLSCEGTTPPCPDPANHYRTPDGSRHAWFPTLHPEDSASHTNGVIGYTRDGSYLRLRDIGGGLFDVEFPDGSIKRFTREGTSVRTKLTQLRDRFNNVVDVTYSGNTVTFTDKHQRAQVIEYETVTHSRENYQRRPVKITLTAFDGESVVYRLTYTDASFERPCTGGITIDPADPTTLAVPVLSRIDVYDQAEGNEADPDENLALASHTFTYYLQKGTDDECRGGAMQTMTMPTGAQITYDYQSYVYPESLCGEHQPKSPGIWSRQVKDGTNTATWYYTTRLNPFAAHETLTWTCVGSPPITYNEPPEPEEMVNTIYAPSGDKTVSYFTVWDNVRTSPRGTSKRDNSQPFTRRVSSSGKYLSSEAYDCTSFSVSGRTITDNGCVLKRSEYVSYEMDANWVSSRGYNKRVSGKRVEHTEPAGAYVDVVFSDFDGLGHYRKETRTSNIRATAVDDTVTFTNYNPTVGTYSVAADGSMNGTFIMPPDWTPWVLNTYSEQWISNSEQKTKAEFTFDTAKGVPTSMRQLTDTSPDGAGNLALDNRVDLVAAYCRDTAGNLVSERYFGGDRNSANDLPPSTPCSTTPNYAEGEYQINHTYDKGVRKSTSYADTVLTVMDRTIDSNTGLVSAARDSAGVETTYEYDILGRLLFIKPAERAWSKIVWSKAGLLANPRATVTLQRIPNGGAGAALTEEVSQYDGLGRLVRESRIMPNGTVPYRTTAYDAAGNVTATSGFSTATSSRPETTFSGYDVSGRPATVTAPDGSMTTFVYTGVSSKSRTVSVATSPTAESDVTTTEYYDADGKLWKVVEPVRIGTASTPTDVTAVYDYDIGDRLKKVTMSPTGGLTQTREFLYDGRGFLTEEQQPETGLITYGNYDARGHAAERRTSQASKYDLNYSYDSAERLKKTDARNTPAHPVCTGTFLPVTSFEYATTDGAGDNRRKGKVVKTIRYNYVPGNVVYRVTEDLAYDAAGRLSSRTTSIHESSNCTTWTNPRIFQQTMSYTELDAPKDIQYPWCGNCSTGADSAPSRIVQPEYSRGLLDSVPGFIDGVTYDPNGLVATVTHSNAMVDTQIADPSGLPRPSSIQFGSWQTCTIPAQWTSLPPAHQEIQIGASVTLQAAANGTPAPSYKWYRVDASAGDVEVASGSSYTASPQTTTTYAVVASNACGGLRSGNFIVAVLTGTPATIQSGTPADRDVVYGGSATLTVTAQGTAPLTYQWYAGDAPNGTPITGATSTSYTTPQLTGTAKYYVVVDNDFGPPATSRGATVYVTPGAPGTLSATRSGSAVQLAWGAAAGAVYYMLQRQDSGIAFRDVIQVNAPQTSVADSSCPADKTCVYRVRALDSSAQRSGGQSNHDLTTRMTFTVISSGTSISFDSFNETLGGINRVRAAIGAPALSWAALLDDGNPSTPPVEEPAVGRRVRAAHLLALRQAMNAALQLNGVAVSGYTDPALTSGYRIKAMHVTQLQGRTQ